MAERWIFWLRLVDVEPRLRPSRSRARGPRGRPPHALPQVTSASRHQALSGPRLRSRHGRALPGRGLSLGLRQRPAHRARNHQARADRDDLPAGDAQLAVARTAPDRQVPRPLLRRDPHTQALCRQAPSRPYGLDGASGGGALWPLRGTIFWRPTITCRRRGSANQCWPAWSTRSRQPACRAPPDIARRRPSRARSYGVLKPVPRPIKRGHDR